MTRARQRVHVHGSIRTIATRCKHGSGFERTVRAASIVRNRTASSRFAGLPCLGYGAHQLLFSLAQPAQDTTRLSTTPLQSTLAGPGQPKPPGSPGSPRVCAVRQQRVATEQVHSAIESLHHDLYRNIAEVHCRRFQSPGRLVLQVSRLLQPSPCVTVKDLLTT